MLRHGFISSSQRHNERHGKTCASHSNHNEQAKKFGTASVTMLRHDPSHLQSSNTSPLSKGAGFVSILTERMFKNIPGTNPSFCVPCVWSKELLLMTDYCPMNLQPSDRSVLSINWGYDVRTVQVCEVKRTVIWFTQNIISVSIIGKFHHNIKEVFDISFVKSYN